MVYYCFNRCTEEDLTEIEKVIKETNLDSKNNPVNKMEERGDNPCSKGMIDICWEFHPFRDQNVEANVRYKVPHNKGYPLLIQTTPLNQSNEEVLILLKEFIQICLPERIVDGNLNLHDLTTLGYLENPKLQYSTSNLEDQPFVEEIRNMENFNNIHLNLPLSGGSYRTMLREAEEVLGLPISKEKIQLWNSIDEYLAHSKFNLEEFEDRFKEERLTPLSPWVGKPSQLMLCPLYIDLRKNGFGKQSIIA